jgi:hypothetical protein
VWLFSFETLSHRIAWVWVSNCSVLPQTCVISTHICINVRSHRICVTQRAHRIHWVLLKYPFQKKIINKRKESSCKEKDERVDIWHWTRMQLYKIFKWPCTECAHQFTQSLCGVTLNSNQAKILYRCFNLDQCVTVHYWSIFILLLRSMSTNKFLMIFSWKQIWIIEMKVIFLHLSFCAIICHHLENIKQFLFFFFYL